MIVRARKEDALAVAGLAVQMWEDNVTEELAEELAEVIESDEGVIFVAKENEKIVGFAQCQLRHDYVEGTESSPVGYLEGVFVKEECRNQGIAKELLQACENWALEKGCHEFASDCELENQTSLKFHMSVGFEEANRVICFAKKLGKSNND